MMEDLKVGDHVRLKADTKGWLKFAGHGRIIEVTELGYTVQPDDKTNRPVPAIIEDELELVDS